MPKLMVSFARAGDQAGTASKVAAARTMFCDFMMGSLSVICLSATTLRKFLWA